MDAVITIQCGVRHICRIYQQSISLSIILKIISKFNNYSNCDFFPCPIAQAVGGRDTVVALSFSNITKKRTSFDVLSNGCSNNLSSRAVSSKVLSALVSLTSVFGMRTGGTSPLTSPQWYIYKP